MSHKLLIILTVFSAVFRALTHLALHIAGPSACRYLGVEGEEYVRTRCVKASSKKMSRIPWVLRLRMRYLFPRYICSLPKARLAEASLISKPGCCLLWNRLVTSRGK